MLGPEQSKDQTLEFEGTSFATHFQVAGPIATSAFNRPTKLVVSCIHDLKRRPVWNWRQQYPEKRHGGLAGVPNTANPISNMEKIGTFCTEKQGERTTEANVSRSFKQRHLFFARSKPAVVATSRKKSIKGSLKISVGERKQSHEMTTNQGQGFDNTWNQITADLRPFEASNWDDCRTLLEL